MLSWKSEIHKYRFVLISLVVYFSSHLISLTKLPIFNDESIYLDWAWNHVNMPGHLFDSLLDAKQPLLIWTFSIFERIFIDPLLAGRLTSVLIGSVTMTGIYFLAKKVINPRTAFFAALLYSVIPIFVFYDRQALMEAAVGCVGIWSCFSLLEMIEKPNLKIGVILGVIVGLGFFIKSTTLLFIVPAMLITTFYLFKNKSSQLLRSSTMVVVSFLVVVLPLLLQRLFWETFFTNNRYTYTPSEIMTFPLRAWFEHSLGFIQIGTVFLSPLFFLTSLVGIFVLLKTRLKNTCLMLVFFCIALILEIFLVKSQGQRYLVAFLPFLVIPGAYIYELLWKGELLKKIVVVLCVASAALMTLIMLINPRFYIVETSKISSYALTEYIYGQTSGYGINEAMSYIREHSSTLQPSMIMYGSGLGNPENAVDIYSQKDKNLLTFYIDAQFFSDLDRYACLTSKYPVFFITRNDQLHGMDRYFSLDQTFSNPVSADYSVRIYTLKKDCQGETASLSDIYQGAVKKAIQLKSIN